jgi:hypothetical protein
MLFGDDGHLSRAALGTPLNARMGGKSALPKSFSLDVRFGSPGCDASFALAGTSAAQGIGAIRQSARESRYLSDGIA